MEQETAEPKKPGSGREKQPIIPSPVAMFREKNFGLKMAFGCPKTSQSRKVWESHAKMLPLHNLGTFANPLEQLATASNFLGFGAKNPSAAHDFESVLSCFKSLPPAAASLSKMLRVLLLSLCKSTSFYFDIISPRAHCLTRMAAFLWHYKQTKSKANPAIAMAAMANPAISKIDFGCCF